MLGEPHQIEPKPVEPKPATVATKPIEQKPATVATKPVEQKPTTVATKPIEQKQIEQRPIEQKPVEPTPGGIAPSEPNVGRPELSPAPTGPENRHGWYTDPLTDVLLGVGVLSVAAATYFYLTRPSVAGSPSAARVTADLRAKGGGLGIEARF